MWFALCACLGRRSEDPEQEPLFPPRSTVLSPPRPRPPPLRPFGGVQSDGAIYAPGTSRTRESSSASLGELGRRSSSQSIRKDMSKLESISRVFSSKMMPLTKRSNPPTPAGTIGTITQPSSPVYHTHAHPTPSHSNATTPGPYPRTYAHIRKHLSHNRQFSDSRILSTTHPHRPAVPDLSHPDHDYDDRDLYTPEDQNRFSQTYHPGGGTMVMGRSVSEPRSLGHMDHQSFAAHQLPPSGSSSPGMRALRGGLILRGRQRSATFVDRMSPVMMPLEGDEESKHGQSSSRLTRRSSGEGPVTARGRRGRSPLGLTFETLPRERFGRFQSDGVIGSSEAVGVRMSENEQLELESPEIAEEEVVHVSLGLESSRGRPQRGRGRSRGRGRR